MPFQPIQLLLLYDDQHNYCGRVVNGMTLMLERRGFNVRIHRIQDGPIDIKPYKGLVIGSPTFGLGVRGVAPTKKLFEYVQNLEEFDRHKVAVFCVYPVQLGTSLDRMKGMVLEKGGEVVAARGYPLWKLDPHDHVIPTECMVRIR
jgi:flavorubredoxin